MKHLKPAKKLSLGSAAQLDKVVPLVSLGLVAYFAGKAAADKRAHARQLAQLSATMPVPLEAAVASAVAANGQPAKRRLGRTRQILFLLMMVGVVALVAGGGTFATFSAETANPGSTVASGTLTLSDQVPVNNATACLSKDAASLDNYNEGGTPTTGQPCQMIVALANEAPGTTDTSGNYPGGFAKVVLANTGSINASLFSLFAPYVNARLTTGLTVGQTIGSGQTVTSLAVTPLEGPVTAGDTITVAGNGAQQTFCAGANANPGATSISISGGYPIGTSGSCPVSVPTTTLVDGNGTSSPITVLSASGFPASGSYVIQVDSEQMLVTAGQGTTSWTVTRGYNGTSSATHSPGATVSLVTILNGGINATTTSITVNSAFGYPTSGTYVIKIGSEQMLVTGGQGTTTWTVVRGFNGTTAATASNGAGVTSGPTLIGANFGGTSGTNVARVSDTSTDTIGSPTTTLTEPIGTAMGSTTLSGAITTNSQTAITVAANASFPQTQSFTILVGNELMHVTAGMGTNSWTVTRGYQGTTAASSFPTGEPVTQVLSVPNSFSSSFLTPPFTILVDNEQMRVTAEYGTPSAQATGWVVTRAYNSTVAAAHNAGATISGVPNTDCFDAQTGVSYQVNGSSYGSQLNFNSPTLSPLCAQELFWIQESTNYGGSTYHFCWFGRGGLTGDQTLYTNGSGQDAQEDSQGMCRTPTTMVLASTVTAGSASYSNVDVGTLAGNIKSTDTITFTESGNTMTCTANGGPYYIGMNTHTSNITVSGCSGGGSQVFDGNAVVKDLTAFNELNTTNAASTLANFDTSHRPTAPIYMAPLISDGHRIANANNNPAVELGKSGTAGSSGVAPDTRTFYVGVYVPAGSGNAQNAIQGLVSTFGLTWHIDQ